jgi:hypothetical protein
MTRIQASLPFENERESLAGVFEDVYQHIALAPIDEASRILVTFVASLVDMKEFNLAKLDALPVRDRVLALALLEYCMSHGLSEDERLAVSAAFAPWVDMCSPASRH